MSSKACIETALIETPCTKRNQGTLFRYALGHLCFKPPMYLLNWLPSSYLLPWFHSSTRAPQQTLTALPLEIIIAILNELDWCDLLKVRMLCKVLNVISRTHGVWTTQYYRYATEKKLRPRLEEPLGSYSAEELERWVLMRRSADLGWSFESCEPTRERRIQYQSPLATCLVQGGRWLLVGGGNGSVMAYDLDAPEIRGTVLIPPRDAAEPQPVNWIAIDIDETAPKLTFALAVSPRSHQIYTQHPSLRIQIWKVTLSGHGSEAHLTAGLSKSFLANERAIIRSITLRGRLFARHMFTPPNNQLYIEVFDWMESTSSMHRRMTIRLGDATSCIRILSDHRLLAVSMESLLVFDISQLDNVDPVVPAFPQTTTEPQWAVPYDGLQTSISDCLPSFMAEQASYHVLNSGKVIHGLTIPHAFDQPPRLIELMQLPHKSVCSFVGFEKAIVRYLCDLTVVALSFSWRVGSTGNISKFHTMDTSSPSQPVELDFFFSWKDASLVMDEDTGRFALRLRDDILVADTALCFTSCTKDE